MATTWKLRGRGYEFCNCDFGCGCNFGGFPNSDDGSCRAIVGMQIAEGSCGDVDLSGVTCAAIVAWPKAIHEGNGKSVFIVDEGTTEAQIEALAQILSGQLGGLPWELLGPTMEVVGLEKVPIVFEGQGLKTVMKAEGLFEARGDTLKNPVSGEDHQAIVNLPTGFIWTRGECGTGSFTANAGGISLDFDDTNWILYDFDWSNEGSPAAAA
jgi:hypothetical protein